MKFSKKEIIEFRLSRAKEAFADGEMLATNNRWNSAANRFYYACFYSISAYLVKLDIDAATHAGIKSTFNKLLVKTGKVSIENGKLFNNLFRIRHETDYDDFSSAKKELLEPLIPKN